ncbi:site-specific DNA-methyltransferase, partial [Amycolatopsis sp. NPDC006131]
MPRALISALDATNDVSVWTTAQSSPAAQRKGKYTPESTPHPAKMLPDVVRHAVEHYTAPGE